MKSNIFLIAICDLGPLQFLLWGLIPFLLGLLLGWLLWSRFKKRVDELESQIRILKETNDDLSAKLDKCQSKYDDLLTQKNNLDSDFRTYKTRYSSLEGEVRNLTKYKTDFNAQVDMSKSKYDDLFSRYNKLEADLANCRSRYSKLELQLAANKPSLTDTSSSFVASTVAPIQRASSNLKKIEGVGPKSHKLLNDAGIHSFSDLSDARIENLRNIFAKAGPNYQLIDPDSWPTQAKLARDGKWDELNEYQDYLIGGVDPAKLANTTTDDDLDLSVAKSIFGKKIALNDLKIIEGIGPKIEGIISAAGITTWRQLSSTSVSRLNSILDEHDLQLHDPKTWPRQATLAASGLWKELLIWQDDLIGGKE